MEDIIFELGVFTDPDMPPPDEDPNGEDESRPGC
jgi:hypothetical protein